MRALDVGCIANARELSGCIADMVGVRPDQVKVAEWERAAGGVALVLNTYMLKRHIVNPQWPRDWWQHLKQRFAPQWFLRRWPVRYRTFLLDTEVWFPDGPLPKWGRRHFYLQQVAPAYQTRAQWRAPRAAGDSAVDDLRDER